MSNKRKIARLRKQPDRLHLRDSSSSESSNESDESDRTKQARIEPQANNENEDDVVLHDSEGHNYQSESVHSGTGSESNRSQEDAVQDADQNAIIDQVVEQNVGQDADQIIDQDADQPANPIDDQLDVDTDPDDGNESGDADVSDEENNSDITDYESEGESSNSDATEGGDDSFSESEEEESEEEDPGGEEEIVEGDRPIFNGAPISLHESMMAIVTLHIVHSLTGKCLSDILSLIALHCPVPNLFKNTLYKFKKYFKAIGDNIMICHYFCSGCIHPLENKESICEICEGACGVEYFIELPVLVQLQKMFLRPGFYDALQFRFNRRKLNPDNLEDIYDGNLYQEQFRDNGFLSDKNNLSFMWYSDGVAIFTGSSKYSVWPLFLVINELSYKERVKKENIILAGLWFGRSKPNPNVFLRPFLDFFNLFSQAGHFFKLPDGNEIKVKGKLLCGTCDYQAKSAFMRFTAHNGYYGCCRCVSRGEHLANVHVHRYQPNIRDRQHNEIEMCAAEARRNGKPYMGVKGISLLFFMVPDFIRSLGLDIMHGVFIGVCKMLVHLWFDPLFSQTVFSLRNVVQIVDARLKEIRPPSFVQRMPRSIEHDLAHWKASEYKLFMLYYAIPVLKGVMLEEYYHHFIKLVSAIYLLSQNSVSLADVDRARQLLKSFVGQFANLYGIRYLGINVHQLLHLPDVVLDLGPTWVYSCFFLESMNGYLTKLYHGTRHVGVQICSSMSTFQNLAVMIDALAESAVRKFCVRITTDVTCVKRNEEVPPIGLGCFTIGKYIVLRNIPLAVQQAMETSLNLVGGKYQMFYRLRKKGVMFVAKNYTRSLRKFSSCCLVSVGNARKYCIVDYFLRRTDCECADPCECPPSFYAVGSVYQSVNWVIHDIPDVRLPYLCHVTPTDEVIAFSVNSIMRLCFYFKVDDEIFICETVNSLEVE